MTASFSAFRRQLPGGGYGAPADALGPISALEEMLVLARSGFVNHADASSLEQDLRSALDGIGTATKAALAPDPARFLSILGNLGARIRDPTQSEVLRREVALVLNAFARGSVRRASFEDAYRSYLRSDRDPERCELRLLQFRELAEHAGYDWEHLCARLDSILEDRRSVISGLDPAVSPAGAEIAGLGEPDRLRICAELVERAAGRGDFAVWMVIDHEAIDEPWLDLGPLQIFAGGLWPEGLRSGGTLPGSVEEFDPPAELEDDSGSRPSTDGLALDQVLFARVWLTDVPRGGAPARAREVLEGLIEIAYPESSWRLFQGELVWSKVGGWFGSSLLSPDRAAELSAPVHPVFERTAAALRDLDRRWIERLAGGEEASTAAVRDARLDLAASRHRDPELRVALGTRALERMLPVLPGRQNSWPSLAQEYLLPAWIKYSLYQDLFDVAIASLEAVRLGPTDRQHLKRLEGLIWKPEGPGNRHFSLPGFGRAAEDLATAIDDEGTMIDRLLARTNAMISSPPAALRRITILERRFGHLLARSERQRNTIIHGKRPPDGLLASIDAFLATLGAFASRDLFRHAVSERAATLPLQRGREEFDAALTALRQGEGLLESMFPEEYPPT